MFFNILTYATLLKRVTLYTCHNLALTLSFTLETNSGLLDVNPVSVWPNWTPSPRHLTSSSAAAIITTTTRGQHRTINVDMGHNKNFFHSQSRSLFSGLGLILLSSRSGCMCSLKMTSVPADFCRQLCLKLSTKTLDQWRPCLLPPCGSDFRPFKLKRNVF